MLDNFIYDNTLIYKLIVGTLYMKLNFAQHNQTLELELSGNYLNFDDEAALSTLLMTAQQKNIQNIQVNASELKQWDSSLVVVLYRLTALSKSQKKQLKLIEVPKNLERLINLALAVDRKPSLPSSPKLPWLESFGGFGYDIWQSTKKGLGFIGQCLTSFRRFIFSKAIMRQVDFLFALQDCSYKAIGIVSLVSFMVGLILAFVGAIQLKTFGAQIYVASLVAIGMTRIMGAIMVGIIMAGRTGASYAATIGTMQVNEEIDALKTMGIPTTDFLVLPRIMALTIATPILVILADLMGIIGGATVGILMLDISAPEYYKYTINALDLTNFLVGVFHGLVFGIVISLCGCYFGIYCGRNADSVGRATTQAVVSAIVWMIVVTGIITVIFEVLGI